MLADKGVSIVIAGKFGPNIIQAMKSRGMKYYEVTGKVNEAFSEFMERGV